MLVNIIVICISRHYVSNFESWMDIPILIISMSLFSFQGASGVIFHSFSFFDEYHVSKQNSPDGTPRFAYFP